MRTKGQLRNRQRQVNEILKGEARSLGLGTKESLPRMNAVKGDLAEFSFWAQKEFQEYVRRMLEARGSVSAVAMMNNGARLLGLNPVTTKRYMNKLRAQNGPFSGAGDIVILNPNYKPPEDDDYWQEVEAAMPRESLSDGAE